MITRDVPKGKTLNSTVVLALLCFSAFLTHMLPLSFSEFPFNNDALSVCSISSDIIDSHRLSSLQNSSWQVSHGFRTPLLSVLISYFASITGTTPLHCAQIVNAALAVVIVGGIFLLARAIIGSVLGALTSGLMATIMGTFVFTTASVWNESLGITLLVLLLLFYVRRSQPSFRFLTFVVLMILPLSHHLVAAIGLLVMAFLLVWSWIHAISAGSLQKRHVKDLVLVGVAGTWTVSYYVSVNFDGISEISDPIRIMLLFSCFMLLSLIATRILMPRRYLKWTFAPFIGVGLFVLLVLDYLGLIFPYTPSVSNMYVFLVAASSFLFAMAWYGTEILLETRPVYRAVQVAVALSPLSLIGFGLLEGFSASSQKVFYRTFDFMDIFIFIGAGACLSALAIRHVRLYPLVGSAMVVSLLISFPFAYASEKLLGVRHDTQAYEVDALEWTSEHTNAASVITDERLSYISQSMFGFVKDASLPYFLTHNVTISPDWVCMGEDRWVSFGVNVFPGGTIVVPDESYERVQSAANILYVGGPMENRAVMFVGSEIGQHMVS